MFQEYHIIPGEHVDIVLPERFFQYVTTVAVDYECTLVPNTIIPCTFQDCDKIPCTKPILGEIKKLVRIVKVEGTNRAKENSHLHLVISKELDKIFRKEMLELMKKDSRRPDRCPALPYCAEHRKVMHDGSHPMNRISSKT